MKGGKAARNAYCEMLSRHAKSRNLSGTSEPRKAAVAIKYVKQQYVIVRGRQAAWLTRAIAKALVFYCAKYKAREKR